MNIFFVDTSPAIAAQSLVDKHVVKMILESAQLLSTAHRVLDGQEYIDTNGKRKMKRWELPDSRESVLYKATHVNHPSNIWTRSSIENYNWLTDHFFALLLEYTYRYGKQHKCAGSIAYTLTSPPINLKEYDMTEIPSCMPDIFRISSKPVENYRNYYKLGKSHLHKYTKRAPPEWLVI
jgi:hypothetical protein